jgi:hypothetical protein
VAAFFVREASRYLPMPPASESMSLFQCQEQFKDQEQ